MAWEKMGKEVGLILEVESESLEKGKQGLNQWKSMREENNINIVGLTMKHFKKPIFTHDAEIINVNQSGALVMNRQKVPIADSFSLYAEASKECEEVAVVSNFEFDIVDRMQTFHLDSIQEDWLRILIMIEGKRFSLEIKLENYTNLGKEIRRRYPQCFIFNETEFNRIAAATYGRACSMLRPTKLYYFGGWYEVGNQLQFLHNALPNVQSNIELCMNLCSGKQFLPKYFEVSSEKDKLWLLLLYVLWAQLAKFYEFESIDGLRCVLYLSAPTGTGKTTLAKIFAKALLKDGEKVELRFDDTKASLQENLVSKRDIICLVDDFYAKGNKVDDADFKSKASEITRIVGDGCVKGKMGANRKPLPDRKYCGGVIATGEYIDLNTHSSYLRCWLLNFPANSIFFNASLGFLQQHPAVTKSFLSQWIHFLEKKQMDIRNGLSAQHERFLKEVRTRYPDAYPRFHTNVTTFLSIATFFCDFCSENEMSVNEQDIRDSIWREADEQIDLLHGISPEVIFKSAFNEAVDNAYLRIAESEDVFRKCEYDGFSDGENFFVITARLEDTVTKYAEKRGYGMKLNEALKLSLSDKGILVKLGTAFNFKYTKNRQIEPKRPRLYTLKKMEMD